MTADYSKNPVTLLKEIDSFSGNQLKKREDLQIIFEETFKNYKEKKLEELTFTAKYVQGLKRVLMQAQKEPGVQNLSEIRKDYTSNITKIFNQLSEIISDASAALKKQFEASYLKMNQESFQNLNFLLEDLEWAKKYFNAQKRETPH
jgi:hypothetical protein